MFYTIGEIAKMLHVAPSTLRYYDKEGLLPFVERTSGGIRMFKDEDMSALQIIDCLKQTGMPITEIKKFIDLCMEGDATIDDRLALIDQQYEAMEEQQRKMQATMHVLEYKRWYYKTAKASGTCAVHDEMPKEDVPEEFHDLLGKNRSVDN